MTKDNLKNKLKELSRAEDKEREEYQKKSGYIGLDGSICSKYRKLRRELFELYEKEKEE